jgi:hypothetical protein
LFWMFVLRFAAKLGFGKIGMHGLAIIIFHDHVVPGCGAEFCINRQLIS